MVNTENSADEPDGRDLVRLLEQLVLALGCGFAGEGHQLVDAGLDFFRRWNHTPVHKAFFRVFRLGSCILCRRGSGKNELLRLGQLDSGSQVVTDKCAGGTIAFYDRRPGRSLPRSIKLRRRNGEVFTKNQKTLVDLLHGARSADLHGGEFGAGHRGIGRLCIASVAIVGDDQRAGRRDRAIAVKLVGKHAADQSHSYCRS